MSTETSPAGNIPVTVQSMLEAGVHFGHQTQRWNPKMTPYIYAAKNGVHIINLDLTLKAWVKARKAVVDNAARGKTVLFVGTKKQARDIIKAEAVRTGSFSVTSRWLGGTLTNFQTIRNSIERMRKLEDLLKKADDPTTEIKINKKEKLMITRELDKLGANLGGIREMRDVPGLIVVIDVSKEEIAIAEARRLKIPVVALVDTNSSPDDIDYVIPSNDDATRTIKLFVGGIGDAILEGKSVYAARFAEQERERARAQAEKAEKAAEKAALKASKAEKAAEAAATTESSN